MRLENWKVVDWYGTYILTGDIYEDVRGSFEDGTKVKTSPIATIDFINKVATTKSGSTYILGEC